MIAYILFHIAAVFKLPGILISFFVRAGRRKLPPIGNDILFCDAKSLSDKIRKGCVTCVSVVDAYMRRSIEVNGMINAVIDENWKMSRDYASQLDERIKYELTNPVPAEESILNKPLLGVPFTVKNSIAVKGMAFNVGSKLAKFEVADENDVNVKRVVDAGGIFIGLTNCPELCMDINTNNVVYGSTNNPYDLNRTAGGSSGGEAAMIAAGGSLIGLGTDLGGSLRIPAHCCGLYSHKPTSGLISFDKVFFKCDYNGMYVLGPMSRYVGDLSILFDTMCGDKIKCLNEEDSLDDLVVYIPKRWKILNTSEVDIEIQKAIVKSANHLKEKFNVRIESIDCSRVLRYSVLMWFSTIFKGPNTVPLCQEAKLRRGVLRPWLELIKYMFFSSDHTLFIIVLAFLEQITNFRRKSFQEKLNSEVENLHSYFDRLFSCKSVLLFPTLPTVARKKYTTLFHNLDIQYSMWVNVLGVPATQIPAGLSRENLPFGFQIVSQKFNDKLTLAVATELDKLFGGWIQPSNFIKS